MRNGETEDEGQRKVKEKEGEGATKGQGSSNKGPRESSRGKGNGQGPALTREFGVLVDPEVRPALHDGVISLVRPNGYLACSSTDTHSIETYLRQLARDRVPSEDPRLVEHA